MSGNTLDVPLDRTIVYGLFIRNIPFSTSLWSVIIFQSIFITSLILMCFKYLVKSFQSYFYTFITVFFLSFFTGASYYVSQLMPDIFTASALIGLGLFLAIPNLSLKLRIYLALMIIFSILAHTSNLMTLSCVIILFLIIVMISRLRKKILLRTSLMIAGIIIVFSSWYILPAINKSLGFGFITARCKNIFLMGRMIESGVLSVYLHDECGNKPIKLCEYKDKLPKTSGDYLWNNDIPLYDKDCMEKGFQNCWVEKNKEYEPVINDIVTTPKYLILFIQSCFKESIRQLQTFDVGALQSMMKGSPVYYPIELYYKKELKSYCSAKQAKSALYFTKTDNIQNIVLILSLLILLSCLIIKRLRKAINKSFTIFCIISISGIIINAFTCATFAMVGNRFEGRVIWILPLLVIMIITSIKDKITITPKGNNS